MAFAYGTKSLGNLVGVHPIIRGVMLEAITISEVDFGIYEGVRTIERQRKLVASGASKTLDSMHIPQKDVTKKSATIYGHAVDAVPVIDGQFRWEWGPCFKISEAVDRAANHQGVADLFCWGGVWDRWMNSYGGDPKLMEAAVNAYTDRRRALGKKAFLDGPHFQIGRLG